MTGPTTARREAAPHPETARRRPRWWLWVRIAFQAALVAGAAVFLVHRAGRLTRVGAALQRVDWPWVLVAVGLVAVSIVALARLQQVLLRTGELPVRLTELVPITLASNAVAKSLPAGVFFAEGYAFGQYRRVGASRVLAVWAELAAGALAAAALAAVAFAGSLLARHSVGLVLIATLAFVLVGSLAATALFRRTELLARLTRGVLRRSERFVPQRLVGALRRGERSTEEMACFRPSVRTWAECLFLGIANWGADCGALIAGLLAVGARVPWSGVVLAYAAGQLLAELPFTPGGLGFVEGGLVVVLTRFHLDATAATAGALVYRGVSYWLLVLVGWVAALVIRVRTRRSGAPG